MMTRISNTISSKTGVQGMTAVLLNAAPEIFTSMINCGMIRGKPIIAMIAAFCWAFAAMAARKLNTRLKLRPPKNTIPVNDKLCSAGLPRNKLKRSKLSPLIRSINKELKNNLANIKWVGLTIDWKYIIRPRLSCKKLLATALMQINN